MNENIVSKVSLLDLVQIRPGIIVKASHVADVCEQ